MSISRAVEKNRAIFDMVASTYDARMTEMGWVGDQVVAAAIAKHATRKQRSGLALDLGIGTGGVWEHLEALGISFSKATAVDSSKGMLTVCRQKNLGGKARVNYVQCDLTQQLWAGIPTGATIVTAAGVLEYMPYIQQASLLQNTYEIMGAGSIAAITSVSSLGNNEGNLLTLFPVNPDILVKEAERIGFKTVHKGPFRSSNNGAYTSSDLLVLEKN